MGYIAKNWRGVKNSILSQKFLDKVRPEATLKNKIDDAGKKMEYQIRVILSIMHLKVGSRDLMILNRE